MNQKITINDITIRNDLKPGDIGYVTYLHGVLYKREYDYGIAFEAYVGAGFHEFHQKYNPQRERVWVCEHQEKIIGFLLLMDRGDSAQLRYFLIEPAYRGIGLGKRLMESYMEFLKKVGYKSSYLWTTNELHTASALYKRNGFVLAEEKPSVAFGKSLFEQKYELRLANG
ncbi:MAG TPA: GNAT family N-acetyltransferase [Bacteroidota bacterium]|jgi:peptidyl-dipeptidase Dcp|nr:GNAT family N-acetyltransferase [Bacteroidota bacterium]